jgi:hypothetical protein
VAQRDNSRKQMQRNSGRQGQTHESRKKDKQARPYYWLLLLLLFPQIKVRIKLRNHGLVARRFRPHASEIVHTLFQSSTGVIVRVIVVGRKVEEGSGTRKGASARKRKRRLTR